jgi:DNA-binding NtrC family response regulator
MRFLLVNNLKIQNPDKMENQDKFKIFLVDDNPVCINLYKRFLIQIGYRNISSFTDSWVFLGAIDERPDLIFLDYHLDDRNGIDLLDTVKKRYPQTVIVFVSGQKDLMVAVKSLKHGAFDYIIKDEFTLEKMQLIVDRVVSIRGERVKQVRKTELRHLLTTTWLFSMIFFFQKTFSRI